MVETVLRFVLLGIMVSLSLAQNPICNLEMNEGSGTERKLNYFYDRNSDACVPFFYKGQEGNENRFESDKLCMQTCSTKGSELYPTAEEDVCSLPKDHGTCFAMILMHYYDNAERNCRVFHYGGCQGNANRFSTRGECMEKCMAKAGRLGVAVENPDEVKTSTGLIVGIVGGVIFAVSICMAIGFFVKQRMDKSKMKGREQVPAMEMN